MHDRFSNLLHADAPANALIDGVSGELELPGLDLPADLIYKRHAELAVLLRPSSALCDRLMYRGTVRDPRRSIFSSDRVHRLQMPGALARLIWIAGGGVDHL